MTPERTTPRPERAEDRHSATETRLYLAVAAIAVTVHLGALWNRFAMDDRVVIVLNPLVQSGSGIWRAFAEPYWRAELGAKLYRPLTVATFAADRLLDGAPVFHAVNLLWHAGVSVGVAALARRWNGRSAGLVAGTVFAVHPVHVEAVASLVGRAELMAALFALLAVYAALERRSIGWSTAALALGLLSKETAAVTPGLIVWGWLLGFSRPPRRRLVGFTASWLAIGAAYVACRWAVLHPYGAGIGAGGGLAPVFRGESPFAMRLTAVAALADVGRLLVFPLELRADYSPAERTIVRSPVDVRFALGLLVFALSVGVVVLAWRRGRRTEAYGLGWIALAFVPVANLLFPVGILVAERTLYLPSVGLALAAGGWSRGRSPRRLAPALAAIVVAGAVRTALRVPVWRDDDSLTASMLDDSPRSYVALSRAALRLQHAGKTEQALRGFRLAIAAYDREPMVFVSAADAAFTLGRPRLADSLLLGAVRRCGRCVGQFRFQVAVARSRGDSAVADSLLVRLAEAP